MLALGGLWAGLARAWRGITDVHAAVHRLLPPEEPPHPSAPPAPTPSVPHATAAAPSAAWQLEHVSLQRGVAGHLLLNARHLTIATGSVLHVTGPSGIGKSSVGALLCGLLPATQGQVQFAGKPVMDYPEDIRLGRIAVLPQDAPLLSATLRDNLTLANPHLTDAPVREALAAVGLGHMSNGLDIWVGLNGRHMSGGEARRIALIRTVLQQSEALILDEPYRGLDDTTAQHTAAWIRASQKGRTLVILDHQARFAQAEDQILDLERQHSR